MKRSGIGAIIGLAAGSAVWAFGHLSSVPKAINNVVSRRNFVRNATLAAIVIVLGQLGAGFVRFFWPNKIGAFGSVLTVPASDIPATGDQPFTYTAGKFYLVNLEEGLMALYWKCTHLGCTVPWVPSEDRFHCPCHGSVFFENGVKESGPAPRPLDYFPVTVMPTGDVQVNTGMPTTRHDFNQDQAVAYP